MPAERCGELLGALGQSGLPGRNMEHYLGLAPFPVPSLVRVLRVMVLPHSFVPVVMLVSRVIEPLLRPPGQRLPGPGSPGHRGDVPRCSTGATPRFSPGSTSFWSLWSVLRLASLLFATLVIAVSNASPTASIVSLSIPGSPESSEVDPKIRTGG